MNFRTNKDLIKKVYFTVLYLNCLNHPPTSFEVWRIFLDFDQKGQAISFEQIIFFLQKLKNNKKIFNKKGFWILKNKDELAQRRIINQKNSLIKLRRVRRSANLIKHLPFIRGLFVAGTLAFGNSSSDSDWDVLIIMKRKRIWLGRLILTVFLMLTGQKRNKKRIKDRFCLNHFLSDNNLISECRNEYTACEYGFIFPIFGKSIFNNFSRLNWNWLRKFLPNFEFTNFLENSFLVKEKFSFKIRYFLECVLEFIGVAYSLNFICKKWMTKRIEKNPETFRSGSIIIFNDGELAFWPEFKKIDNIIKW